MGWGTYETQFSYNDVDVATKNDLTWLYHITEYCDLKDGILHHTSHMQLLCLTYNFQNTLLSGCYLNYEDVSRSYMLMCVTHYGCTWELFACNKIYVVLVQHNS